MATQESDFVYFEDADFVAAGEEHQTTPIWSGADHGIVLGYVTEGQLDITLGDGSHFSVSPGMAYWLAAESAQRAQVESQAHAGLWVMVQGDRVERARRLGLVPTEPQAKVRMPAYYEERIRELVRLTLGRDSRKQGDRVLLFEALLCDMLDEADPEEPDNLESQISGVIEQIVRYPMRDFDFRTIAENCGTSYTNFRRVFRRLRQRSPHDFLLKCRMDRASRELELSNRSIKEIAAELGFDSVSHFSRTFKKRFGTSPVGYRAERGKRHDSEPTSGVRNML